MCAQLPFWARTPPFRHQCSKRHKKLADEVIFAPASRRRLAKDLHAKLRPLCGAWRFAPMSYLGMLHLPYSVQGIIAGHGKLVPKCAFR